MKRVPRGVLLRCFTRSLFLQSAWNVRGMQNVGFAFAIWPALRYLYPDAAARREAVQRHLEVFNTQPYMAEAVLGGAIHHEAQIAAGESAPSGVVLFKQALAGPLAALGDTFFWGGLRPAAGAVGVALIPLVGMWAVPLFLLFYNAVHLAARIYLFRSGIALGDDVLAVVGSLHLAERATLLKRVAAVATGVAVVAWTASQASMIGVSVVLTAAGAALGAAGLIPLLQAGVSPYVAAGAAVGVGLVVGLAGFVGGV